MKINGFQNIPAVLQSFRTEGSPNSSSVNGNDRESAVSLSSFGEVLQNLQRESTKRTSLREAQVESLSQMNQKGELAVDLERLASRLVDLNVVDLQG